MTDRLKEIEERLEKATPGPWEYNYRTRHISGVQGNAKRIVLDVVNVFWGEEETHANGQLFAHAPGDLRYLLNEVARLKGVAGDFLEELRKEARDA